MAKVQLRNEILFKAPTRVGLLADVTEALAQAGVNILAIGAYDKGGNGEFLLLTNDNKKTGEVLDTMGDVDLAPVVVLEVDHSPGTLAAVARRIANAGINVSQIHATTTDAPTATIVLRTEREAEVVELLEGL